MSQLWIQDTVSKGKIRITKVRTEDNLSGALTTHVKSEILRKHVSWAGQSVAWKESKLIKDCRGYVSVQTIAKSSS